MKYISMMLLAVLLLGSCKEKQSEEAAEAAEETQMERVMRIHDELMPKMTRLGQLEGEVRATMDSLQNDTIKLRSIALLKRTNEKMMNWMMEFGEDFDSEQILDGKELTDEQKKLLYDYEVRIKKLRIETGEVIQRVGMKLEAEREAQMEQEMQEGQ